MGSSLPAGSSETLQSLPQCRENSTVPRVSSPYRPEGKRPGLSIRAPSGVWIAHIGALVLPDGDVLEPYFRKPDEEKLADTSV